MDTLNNVNIEISVVLGNAHIPIHQLLRMGRGAVIELDTTEDDDVQILANNVPIAKGQVVLHDDQITVSVTEVLPRSPSYRPRETTRIVG